MITWLATSTVLTQERRGRGFSLTHRLPRWLDIGVDRVVLVAVAFPDLVWKLGAMIQALALFFCLAPVMTLAADDRAGIEAFNLAFAKATRQMDNAAVLALWEDDGTSLLPPTTLP